jgi:hypothetical protein
MLKAALLVVAMLGVHALPAVSGVSVPKMPAGGFCEKALS